jgi:serine/threonine protein kinase
MLAVPLEAGFEGETTQPTPVESNRSFEEWLDDLSAGECSWETLFRGVRNSVVGNPDSGWTLLSLVDQYFRRHKISADEFQGLNGQVQALLIRRPQVAEPKISQPRIAEPQSRPLAAKPQEKKLLPEKVTEIATAAAAAADPRALVANEVLRNRYRIQGVLAHGGMGTIYAALDEFLVDEIDGAQRVAIKVLHTAVAQRPQLLAELRSEFQILQTLSHPNIVRVHDFDRDGDLTFFTMERLSGGPLSRLLTNPKATPLKRQYALAIIQAVGAAIAYAHSRDVVHGDLNPGNIFITDWGDIRVLDFGASCRVHREPTIPNPEELSRIPVATPSYSSCEVLNGGPANVRDDIYALACVSYVLLTGRHPFQGRNALQARAAHLSPRRPIGISQRQWSALKDGLSFNRQRRPADIQTWLDQLNLPSEPIRLPLLQSVMNSREHPRTASGWLTGGLIALAAAMCWWAVQNPKQVSNMVAGVGSGASGVWNSIRSNFQGGAAPTVAAQPLITEAPPAPPARTPAPVAHAVRRAAAPVALRTQGTPAATQAPAAAYPQSARIEMAADAVDVDPVNSVASVIIKRRDNYRNNVSFTWWTEPGTAKPGQDFVPVNSRVEYIPSGVHEAHALVPIVADPRRTVAKSFYVVIDEPSDGATLGSRRITMVTIPPEG